MKIRVALVDDHAVVRHGLRLLLDSEPDMEVVGEASRGAEAAQMAREARPNVMVLDVRLGDLDGPEVCRRVLLASPETAVVMLTNYQHDDLVLRSLLAGAKGYVIKDVQLDELKNVIRSVHRGDSVLDPKVTARLVSTVVGAGGRGGGRRAPSGTLSETDLAIIRLLSVGLTNKEISARVNLSPHTIKDHIEKLCTVFGVRSRVEVVAEALRRGLI